MADENVARQGVLLRLPKSLLARIELRCIAVGDGKGHRLSRNQWAERVFEEALAKPAVATAPALPPSVAGTEPSSVAV